MAIIETCCFWKSLRRASFACGFYTLIYFIITSITMSIYLNDEKKYLIGEVAHPQGESVLEKERISSTTVIFYILLLICESIGILSSILLLIGLHLDKRELLLPWILNIIVDILIECSHCVYMFIVETTKFEPLTAIIFTTDFFITCLTIYCLVCVISQYQEYKAGRGSANDISPFSANVRYIPPSQTTCVSNIKPTKIIVSPICPHTNFSSIPEEPSIIANHHMTTNHKSPFHRRGSNFLRKHVQFPDENQSCNHHIILNEVKLQGKIIEIDPLPEYSENILSWHEQHNKSSH